MVGVGAACPGMVRAAPGVAAGLCAEVLGISVVAVCVLASGGGDVADRCLNVRLDDLQFTGEGPGVDAAASGELMCRGPERQAGAARPALVNTVILLSAQPPEPAPVELSAVPAAWRQSDET
jgi:hypothetical protein